jgi:nitrogen fixation NifU-like protein
VDALYQKQILDYAHKSRASVAVEQPTHTASFNNPVCGDRVDITLTLTDSHVEKMGLVVRGCALCEAGGGLALDCLTGLDEENIRKVSDGFTEWINGTRTTPPVPAMENFTPVRSIRNRHKCVLLAFNATLKALRGK